ncbi:ribonuclease HII [Spirochaetia bacterium]|nr:ribonuclease HII [Spirochaetia bacterium]GHV81808.1 ribonuclease HII [Spirochaetia bacterium]
MICGLDEAGRGPLAGPVCAAAVVLPPDFPMDLLNDSKKLSVAKREIAMRAIYQGAVAWGVGWVSAVEIDAINIHQASLLAMRRAFLEMARSPAYIAAFPGSVPAVALTVIADGRFAPDIPIPCRALVKADAQIPEVMAASILAKTARDRVMERYSWFYPEYGYDQHKGYPTKEHYARIAKYGPSPIQRMSFRWR